jgi:hypothetical protein
MGLITFCFEKREHKHLNNGVVNYSVLRNGTEKIVKMAFYSPMFWVENWNKKVGWVESAGNLVVKVVYPVRRSVKLNGVALQ